MASSLNVPISAKLRFCQPVGKTAELAHRLQNQGASWITLHARTVSARRRRQGAADLSVVKELKAQLEVPVISNGNVRTFSDLQTNLDWTGADGVMVGETLLDNPCLFANIAPDPLQISLEYLELCAQYPETVTLATVQAHVRHFVESQCDREPWYPTFRERVKEAEDVNAIEDLIRQNQRESGETGATKPIKESNLLDLDEDDAVNFGLGFLD